MKRILVFLLLIHICFVGVCQIKFAKKVIYPVSNNWVNIKFDPNTIREPIPQWNWFLENSSPKTGLLDEAGVNSGYSIEYVSGVSWDYEQQSPSVDDSDFPLLVQKHMVYTGPNGQKTLRIGGLDNSKTYNLLFGVFYSAGGTENRAKIVVNGTDYNFTPLTVAGSLSKCYVNNITPTGGFITFQIIGTIPMDNYACVNGMKIKQN